MNPDLIKKLEFWMTERETIRQKKDAGTPKPWTDDPVLQQFKFCNVRREDDRVTRWFAANWRAEKYWAHGNFVSAIILGRIINWPATLEEIGFPEHWDAEHVFQVLESRKNRGVKVYTGAYMVSQYGSTKPKNELVVDNAIGYFARRPVIYATLEATWRGLLEYEGVGSFMAGQVIADVKQTSLLRSAKDWFDWAPLGPGSTRGINRIYGRPINFNLGQEQGLEEMREIRRALSESWMRDLCLHDIQNCMCEFDKYMRVLMGQGVPRSRYEGFGP